MVLVLFVKTVNLDGFLKLNCFGQTMTNDNFTVVAHSMSLPRGTGILGILLTRDKMALFHDNGEVDGSWKLEFVGMDANIESDCGTSL